MPNSTTVTVGRSRTDHRDILWVRASDGTDLGWYDLDADVSHPGSELLSLVVEAAGAGWRSGSGSPLLNGAAPLITVSRWAHDGQDTLQIYAYDGTKLGVYDLTAQRPEPVTPYMDLVVHAAAAAYLVGCKSAPRGATRSNLHITHVKTPERDRLLVTSYDGHELGWYDLDSEQAHPSSEIMSLVVEAAGMGWLASHRAITGAPESPLCPGRRLGSHLRALVALDPRWSFSIAQYELHPGQIMDVHVVTGPAGVYLIAAMDVAQAAVAVHNDRVWVDGTVRDSVGQAQHASQKFSALLSANLGVAVLARPVLATFGATKFVLPRQPDGLSVIQGDCIVSWLRQRREAVADPEVLATLQKATDATWQFMSDEVELRRATTASPAVPSGSAQDEWNAPHYDVTEEIAATAQEIHALLLGDRV